MIDECVFCTYAFPRSETRCPHCAQPGRFPNVLDAQDEPERQALHRRYRAAIQDANGRGCGIQVEQFEAELARSHAVINRSGLEVERLATSDNQLYATYYGLIDAGVRVPSGEKWDRLRAVADIALFGDTNKSQIRFAALALNGIGLDNYGEYSLVARDDMIAHRASVFEENSVKFMERHKITFAGADKLPKGYRASWSDRAKLGIAKLAAIMNKSTKPGHFSKILLDRGNTSDGDHFVEVHIMGPMTIRTFGRVIVRRKRNKSRTSILNATAERLQKFTVPLEVV